LGLALARGKASFLGRSPRLSFGAFRAPQFLMNIQTMDPEQPKPTPFTFTDPRQERIYLSRARPVAVSVLLRVVLGRAR
jgi:hypothetical protein